MDLYVVRHGETWANAEQRYLGSLDPALAERGREQAQGLVANLPSGLDAVLVSPRLRALETASILNERLGLPTRTMDCFRERHVGVFEGLTQAEARERYPQLWAGNVTRQWDLGPTGGESIVDVVRRVRGGLQELQSRYPSRRVLLVAHGFVAKTIRALARNDFSDFYNWQLANGSLLALEGFVLPTADLEGLRASLPVG
ncbi:histidine phosphatase family protein [Pseudomonas sp. 148P]|uniref:Histidine phosphatase family protein n=1 Tax=Pseudomonas ulcerans TaxID=3115852 RepID=A0ABU7HZL3_9PSED|nr:MULTISPECIES: histidine phosphatase family protein [unclassified Pseudomonas]MEE1925579.1 histidine phosphatase family protein [Pseudomonas sp. 147P]MEE1937015.1 histidine phosphatase family protein [Pseudomonas sp. 148P]